MIFLPWAIYCFSVYIEQPICPTPAFSLIPNEIKKNNQDLDLFTLEYKRDVEILTGTRFNSLIALKFDVSLGWNEEITLCAKLTLKDISNLSSKLNHESILLIFLIFLKTLLRIHQNI